MTTLDIYAIALAGQERAVREGTAVPPGTAVEPPRPPWPIRLLLWLVRPRQRRGPGALPPQFLYDNHLRRDIGLYPLWPDGWRR